MSSNWDSLLLFRTSTSDSNGNAPRLAEICVIILFLYCIYRAFIYPFYFSPFRNLPEPEGASFPWAHAESIRKQHNGEPFRRWLRDVPNKGIIKFRVLFNRERLLLTSPEAMKEVLVTRSYEFSKPATPAYLFRRALGNGILVAEGADHKRQRKSLTPAFAYRHVKDLYQVFWEKALKSTDHIATTEGPQYAYDWARRLTLDIIGQAAMGFEFNALEDPDQEIIETYRVLFENEPPNFRWTFIGLDLPVRFVMSLPLPVFRNMRKAVRSIRSISHQAIQSSKGKDGKDILSVARRSGQFSDEDLVDQMMTFLAAGHETTASALTWTVYLLCKHLDIQSKLREEIRSKLDPSSPITAAEIDSLPYLNAVCSETLRFMPSVPTTIRDALVDTSIAGVPIAKGTRIFISPWAINVDRSLWGEDAETYNPARWLETNSSTSGGSSTNFANMTFLHGPRSCIGKDFAKAELLCLVAAWVGRFEMRFVEDKEIRPDIQGFVTVHPGHKLPVSFREIPGWS